LPEVEAAVRAFISALQPHLREKTRDGGHHLGELLVGLDELGLTDAGDSVGNDLNVHDTSTFGRPCGRWPGVAQLVSYREKGLRDGRTCETSLGCTSSGMSPEREVLDGGAG
jgi:hypothetical protein